MVHVRGVLAATEGDLLHRAEVRDVDAVRAGRRLAETLLAGVAPPTHNGTGDDRGERRGVG